MEELVNPSTNMKLIWNKSAQPAVVPETSKHKIEIAIETSVDITSFVEYIENTLQKLFADLAKQTKASENLLTITVQSL